MKKCSIILILFALTLVEAADNRIRRPGYYGHHHHLLYYHGIFYYLAFLAVKIKIVLLIGTVITAMVFVGKIFAIIKYGSNILDKKKEAVEEKVVIERPQYMPEYFHSEPSHDHSIDISEHFSSDHEDYKSKPDRYSIGPEYFSSKNRNTKPGRYSIRPADDSKEYKFKSELSSKEPEYYGPTNYKTQSERYSIRPEYFRFKNSNTKLGRYSITPENYDSKDYKSKSKFSGKESEYYGTKHYKPKLERYSIGPEYYSTKRSYIPQQKQSGGSFYRSITNNFSTNFDYINEIINKFNLTDMTFKLMGLEEDNCKKRFICEVYFNAKENELIKVGFELFGNFQNYKIDHAKSLQDCSIVYPNCEILK